MEWPRMEEIGLKLVTTAKFSNKFSRESPYIWQTFSRESPKLQTGFHGSKRKSPSLKRMDGKTVQYGDPNILSLISSMSGANRLLKICTCLSIWNSLRVLIPTTRCNRHTFSKVRVWCILHSQLSSEQTFRICTCLEFAESADSYDAVQQVHKANMNIELTRENEYLLHRICICIYMYIYV